MEEIAKLTQNLYATDEEIRCFALHLLGGLSTLADYEKRGISIIKSEDLVRIVEAAKKHANL